MNANQIPYDQLDWLQIGVYFLALPIVAFVGASLGLIGRWRRGGVLWATNVGLLGGVAACVVCVLAITTLDRKLPAEFVAYFEESYRWQMLAAALGATGGCAVAAAIAWRMTHEPREVQPISFSLRQLMIIQLCSLLSLGAWIGFRLLVLSAVSPREYEWRARYEAVSNWTAVGWQFSGDDQRHATIDLRGMTPDEIGDSFAVLTSKSLKATLPKLEGVSLQISDDSGIDFASILSQPQIRTLSIEFANLSEEHLKQLANSQLEKLGLFGDLTNRDLTPLAKMTTLKGLTLFGRNGRSSIHSLSTSQSLRQLLIHEANLSKSGTQAISWPPRLEELVLGDWPAESFDEKLLQNLPKLKSLQISANLDETDLAALTALSPIERLDLAIGPPTEPLINLLASLPTNQRQLGMISLRINDPDFTQADAALLKRIKKLHWLLLYHAEHGDDVFDELVQIESLSRLDVASPKVTLEGIGQLASAPQVSWLCYPEALKCAVFEADCHDYRTAQNFARLQLDTRKPIPKPTKQ